MNVSQTVTSRLTKKITLMGLSVLCMLVWQVQALGAFPGTAEEGELTVVEKSCILIALTRERWREP